ARRGARGSGAVPPARSGFPHGLRLHRHHRRLPRPAQSARLRHRRHRPRHLLCGWRGGADDARFAERRHRNLPGHDAVLPARRRRTGALPAPLRPCAPGGRGGMTIEFAVAIIAAIVLVATPILLAGLGELVVEKSGVLNLGVEGMMLIGAVTGFAVTATFGNAYLGVFAAALAGAAASMIFGFLTLTLSANQVATGLALTIFGGGFSALAGKAFLG